MYKRKTKDIYNIVDKWGVECREETLKEAKKTAQEYRENGFSVWIEKKRVPIKEG